MSELLIEPKKGLEPVEKELTSGATVWQGDVGIVYLGSRKPVVDIGTTMRSDYEILPPAPSYHVPSLLSRNETSDTIGNKHILTTSSRIVLLRWPNCLLVQGPATLSHPVHGDVRLGQGWFALVNQIEQGRAVID